MTDHGRDPASPVGGADASQIPAHHGQRSSSLTAPKSMRVSALMVWPTGTFCEQTFQFRSSTWWRPAPVASCDLVTKIADPVSFCIAFWASCRLEPTRFGIVQLTGELARDDIGGDAAEGGVAAG